MSAPGSGSSTDGVEILVFLAINGLFGEFGLVVDLEALVRRCGHDG